MADLVGSESLVGAVLCSRSVDGASINKAIVLLTNGTVENRFGLLMDLTIEQALQRGIEAHKMGQLQEAERLYRLILQEVPKHPDANHNLGVLAVSVH